MRHLRKSGSWVLVLLAIALSQTAKAETVAEILALQKAPPGVVFEIVSGDEDRLEEVLPKVRGDMGKLRAKFPGLSIAVVSHGDEQFALSNGEDERNDTTRSLVQSLVNDDKVSFHVCGTYAQMKGVDENAFPDYVDVAPHGPSQIRNYVDFGYIKILVN